MLPRAHGSLSPEIAARMYFSTSSKDNFKDHFSADMAMALGARSSSMKSVLQPQSRWTPSQVPGMQRSMCTYSKEYVQRPLDAVVVNRELGELFAWRGSHGQRPQGVQVPLSSDTTTRASYGAPDAGSAGRGVSCKPKEAPHGDRSAKFMESKTVFQRDFGTIDEGMRKLGRAELVKPAAGAVLPPPMGCVIDVFRTGESSYHQEFSQGSGAGARGRGQKPRRPPRGAAELQIWKSSEQPERGRASSMG